MNLVVLSGRLATEPSLKYLKESGIPVSKFNLAVQKEYYKNDNDKVDFFTIECWNKLAESVVNNLDMIAISKIEHKTASLDFFFPAFPETWKDIHRDI